MTMIAIVPPVSVKIDIPVTRRIKIHAVISGDGDQVFHSRRISEVFTYLLDLEVAEFELLDEDVAFMVKLGKPLSPQPDPKGTANG